MHRHRNSIHRGSASSSKLLILGTQRPSATRPGRSPIEKRTLGPKGIAEYRRAGAEALRARLQNMGADERGALKQLQELAEDDDFDPACLPSGSIHAKARKAEEDCRTRRDRTQLRNAAFQAQMPQMVTAYTRYCAEQDSMPTRARDCTPPLANSVEEEVYTIKVVDMLATAEVAVQLDPRGGGIAPALIMEGLVPCAPWTPNVAIAVRVLEAYRVMRPQLAIPPYVKSLCDIHGVPYKPSLSQQFSIAYDVYLAIRRQTDECIEAS